MASWRSLLKWFRELGPQSKTNSHFLLKVKFKPGEVFLGRNAVGTSNVEPDVFIREATQCPAWLTCLGAVRVPSTSKRQRVLGSPDEPSIAAVCSLSGGLRCGLNWQVDTLRPTRFCRIEPQAASHLRVASYSPGRAALVQQQRHSVVWRTRGTACLHVLKTHITTTDVTFLNTRRSSFRAFFAR